MVGALGVVANAVGTSRNRRDSRNSQSDDGPPTRRPTIGEILASRHVLAIGGGGMGPNYRDRGGGTLDPLNLSNSRPPTEPEKMTLKEQIKFYISLFLGIIASLCVFALLFLIPLVVEPSISTLLADFDPEPATCITIESRIGTGLSRCGTFSSCREGCTSTPSQCYQIYVSYRKANRLPLITNDTIFHATTEWMDESNVQLLINVKGCGYPPRVKCEDFGDAFGQKGQIFDCYYSRSNPRIVVTDYNWEETAFPLLLALGLPTLLFSISIAILSSWYCPSCEERGKNKRPCRSRYTVPRPNKSDLLDDPPINPRRRPSNPNLPQRNKPTPPEPIPRPEPVAHQPLRRKQSIYNPNSPSLATISSGDTTVSSINSLDGWQSPPSPPPRFNSRMNASSKSNLSTRTRKL